MRFYCVEFGMHRVAQAIFSIWSQLIVRQKNLTCTPFKSSERQHHDKSALDHAYAACLRVSKTALSALLLLASVTRGSSLAIQITSLWFGVKCNK